MTAPIPEWEREFLAEMERLGARTVPEPAACPLCAGNGTEPPANLANCSAMTISFALRPAALDVGAVMQRVLTAMDEAGQHVEYSTAHGLCQPYKPGLFPEWGMMLWETHDGPHGTPGDTASPAPQGSA